MTHEYKGWLYGHYDSRGGATLIVTDTREKADKLYAAGFVLDEIYEGEELAEQIKQLGEEDFLCQALVIAHRELFHGEDLEYGDNSPPNEDGVYNHFILWAEHPTEYAADLAKDSTLVLRTSEWSKEPPVPGWHPTELGEDAFGVLFLTETGEPAL